MQCTRCSASLSGALHCACNCNAGSQQEITQPLDQLLVDKVPHTHAPTAATTSAPTAIMTPAIVTLAASTPSRMPPTKAHVVVLAHAAKAAEATTATTQSAVAPPKPLPPSQSVAAPSTYGLSQHACDGPAGGNRAHSSCNRVASSVSRVTHGHGFTVGNPQRPPSSTLELSGNKATAATTSSKSSTADTNASDVGWQRMVGGGSSNKRDVPATSGPHIIAPYNPLGSIRSPTTSSTAGSVPPSDPIVGVTAHDLKELPLLAPKLASSGPPVLEGLNVPPVSASAVTTAPLVLPPPLQLDNLATAATPASAVPAEATLGSAVGSDASSDVGGEGLCVICWDGELTHGLMHDDCIHLCMCSGCSAKYDHDARGCPVCRRAGELIQL